MSAILSVSIWRPSPGRMADFLGAVTGAKAIFSKHGGEANVMETMFGGEPETVVVALRFDGWVAFGKFAQSLDEDTDWQKLREGWLAEKNPIATLVRNGINRVIE